MTSDYTVRLSRIALDMLHDLSSLSAIRPESQRQQAMQIVLDAFQDAYCIMRADDDDDYTRMLLSSNLHEV